MNSILKIVTGAAVLTITFVAGFFAGTLFSAVAIAAAVASRIDEAEDAVIKGLDGVAIGILLDTLRMQELIIQQSSKLTNEQKQVIKSSVIKVLENIEKTSDKYDKKTLQKHKEHLSSMSDFTIAIVSTCQEVYELVGKPSDMSWEDVQQEMKEVEKEAKEDKDKDAS